jgi:hypothetical protein
MSLATEAIKVSNDDIAKTVKMIGEFGFHPNIPALNPAVKAEAARKEW